MAKPTNDGNLVKRTSQYIDNTSFDETTGVKGLAIYGTPDGSNIYRAQVDSSGSLKVAGTISIDTTGLATSAKQDTGNSSLASIDSKITAVNTGAVVVSSGAITETNSAAIKTAVETIDNAISGSEMQVDVVGALPAGTNAIGKLAANSGVDIGDVDVTSSVTSTLDHGSNRDIDTTAEQITSTSFACKFGVTVKADITNTGIIYIGNSDVTAGSTAATDGFPLSAGETLTLEVNNPNLLYAIASANNQKIYWVAN